MLPNLTTKLSTRLSTRLSQKLSLKLSPKLTYASIQGKESLKKFPQNVPKINQNFVQKNHPLKLSLNLSTKLSPQKITALQSEFSPSIFINFVWNWKESSSLMLSFDILYTILNILFCRKELTWDDDDVYVIK